MNSCKARGYCSKPLNSLGFPGGSAVKNLPANKGDLGSPWIRNIPWRRKWQPTLIFLPGKSHGQRCLVGYSPWDRKRVKHDGATKKQMMQQYICTFCKYCKLDKVKYPQVNTLVSIFINTSVISWPNLIHYNHHSFSLWLWSLKEMWQQSSKPDIKYKQITLEKN